MRRLGCRIGLVYAAPSSAAWEPSTEVDESQVHGNPPGAGSGGLSFMAHPTSMSTDTHSAPRWGLKAFRRIRPFDADLFEVAFDRSWIVVFQGGRRASVASVITATGTVGYVVGCLVVG